MLKPRLEKFYENIVCEDFIILYNFKNISGLTCFERAILDSTSNHFGSEPISTMQSFSAWFIGTSQKCVSTRARKSIALFGIRKSNLLGLKVTCRKSALFILLDKLLLFVLPRLLSNSVESNKSSSKVLFTQKLNSVAQNDTTLHTTKGKASISRETSIQTLESSLTKTEKSGSLVTNVFIENKQLSIESVNENNTFNGSKSRTQMSNSFMPLAKQDRSFFVISNKSALAFPEVSQLITFFDSLPGFALSCSVLHKNKGKAVVGVRKDQNVDQTKKQLLSAFQYPFDQILFNNTSLHIRGSSNM